MKQLKAGEFDRLLSGGQAPMPEAKPITEARVESKPELKVEVKTKEQTQP